MKRRPRYRRDPLTALTLLARASMGSAHNPGRQVVVRERFDRLRDGRGEADDFDRVCTALNVATVRAIEIGDAGLKQTLSEGHRALGECRRRYIERGVFGFSGTEIVAMLDAISAYEAIEEASSDLQMERAWNTSKRSLTLQRKGKR